MRDVAALCPIVTPSAHAAHVESWARSTRRSLVQLGRHQAVQGGIRPHGPFDRPNLAWSATLGAVVRRC